MNVAIGGDHAGYGLKTELIKLVLELGHEVIDCGTDSIAPVDYPDFAAAVGEAIIHGLADRGIVVCGSGAGAAIAANKVRGIRATLAHDTYTAHQCVEHDEVNVLTLGSRVIGVALANEVVKAFLGAQFSGEERHLRRLAKIARLEENFGE